MKYFVAIGVLVVIGVGIIAVPYFKERQAKQKVHEAAEQAIQYNDEVSEAINESSRENLSEEQNHEVVLNIVAGKLSGAAGDALYKTPNLRPADQQALVDLVVEKKDVVAAKMALRYSKTLTSSQTVALQAVVDGK